MKRTVFVDKMVIGREDINKKRDTPKGCLCSYLVMRFPIWSGMTSLPVGHYHHDRLGTTVIAGLTGNLLLVERSSNVNSASNCTTYHRVVTDAELIAFCDIICIPERCDGKMSMKVFHYQ